MTMRPTGLLKLSLLIAAFVFALSGVAKLHDPLVSGQFLSAALNIRLDHALFLARVSGGLETVLSVLLCVFIGRSRVPAYVGMCLLAFFGGLLVNVAISYPDASSCGCFGSLMGSWSGRSLQLQLGIDSGLFLLLLAYAIGVSPERQNSRSR